MGEQLTREQKKFFEGKFSDLRTSLRYHQIDAAVKRRLPVTGVERHAKRVVASADLRRRKMHNVLDKRVQRALEKVREAILFGSRQQIQRALDSASKIRL